MTKIIPKKMQLKTLLLNSEHTESMTVIPALPYSFDESGKAGIVICPYCNATIA